MNRPAVVHDRRAAVHVSVVTNRRVHDCSIGLVELFHRDVEQRAPVGHCCLQIKIGVDWEAITSAHRALAKLYHPDRLISYSPEAQELGRHRMSEINAAHATLRALHFH